MKPEKNKTHPGKLPPSNLRRLKNLPPEDRALLVAEKKHHTCDQMIGLIAARHGIIGLTQPEWSRFHHWMRDQEEIRFAHEAVANLREIFDELMPRAGAEETHKFLIDYLTNLGFAQQHEKRERALRFVTTELRYAVLISQQERRLHLLEEQAARDREPSRDAFFHSPEYAQRVREIFHRDTPRTPSIAPAIPPSAPPIAPDLPPPSPTHDAPPA